MDIWDLRTSDGVVRSIKAAQSITAMDSSTFRGSRMSFLGDSNGALYRMDWRETSTLGPELLWSPPKVLGSSLRSHKVMVQRDCVCHITGPYLTMLTINPCVVELGWADATRLSAVASGHGAWALATSIVSGKTLQFGVVLVESSGEARQHQLRKEKEAVEAAAKKAEPKAEKKKEQKGKKPSSGKAQRGGKMSCGR